MSTTGSPAVVTATPPINTRPIASVEATDTVTPVPNLPGLGELVTPLASELAREVTIAHRTRSDSPRGVEPTKESREQGKAQKSKARSQSPARTRRYVLEMWVEVESDPGVYSYPEDDSWSIDFVVDMLNLTYPGCTGVRLFEAGHIVAFYGKKYSPNVGLTVEQSIVACKAIKEMNTWMGEVARWKVRAISLTEASEILAGLKRLEKESLRRLKVDLMNRASSLQLASALSASAKPFVPLATSSVAAKVGGPGPVAAPTSSMEVQSLDRQPTRPLDSSEDEGSMTEGPSQ